jgi:hypothetical protein
VENIIDMPLLTKCGDERLNQPIHQAVEVARHDDRHRAARHGREPFASSSVSIIHSAPVKSGGADLKQWQ